MSDKLKKHGISLKQLGEMFGYKNYQSFMQATRKDKIIEGAESIVDAVENSLKPNSSPE